jgi:uncharacterized protein YciI
MEVLYTVRLNRGENYDLTKSIYEQDLLAHALYLKKNLEGGYVLMAGLFSDSSGAQIILKANDESQARIIMDNDPAVLNKIFSYEVNTWLIRFNALEI